LRKLNCLSIIMGMYKRILLLIAGIGLIVIFAPQRTGYKPATPAVLGTAEEAETNEKIHPAPELAEGIEPPKLSAKAGFAYDLSSGTILYSRSFDEQLPIASLTKLITALTAMDFITDESVITVQPSDVRVIGSNLGLVPGEQIRAYDVLSAMLISSSNDAAQALARHVGGSQEKFVEMMNRKAESLGLVSTKFGNPVGLDSSDNYSTAYDLSRIVAETVKNPVISKIVETKEMQIKSIDGKYSHKSRTTNRLLLENPTVVGIKTGFTSGAKGNLIIRSKQGNADVITIVLGSDNREQDTRDLLEWIWSAYRW
jgi:serine-type D-Ala-D-Ala carboxypeptidase (penicillin-binding protein 5/6)